MKKGNFGAPSKVVSSTWASSALTWLGKRKAAPGSAEERPRKLQRQKAQQWISALQSVLETSTGHGLLRYCPEKGNEVTTDLPFLSLHADAGSDGLAASFYLRYHMKLNIEFWADPSHQWWRDMINSWSKMGWSPWVRLMCVVLNLAHGPWEDGSRWWQLRLSTQEYLDEIEPTECPLFMRYFGDLIFELSMEDLQSCDDIYDLVWQRLREHWMMEKRGTKIALCRFASFIDAALSFKDSWTFSLIRLVYYGMATGMFDGTSLSQKLGAKIKTGDLPSGRQGVKHGDADQARLRVMCQSNVHLSAVLLSDYVGRARLRAIAVCTEAMREWHGHQSQELRSAHSTFKWLCDQLSGGMLKPLRETMQYLEDPSKLSEIGITIRLDPAIMALTPDHPVITDGGAACDEMGRYILTMVAERVQRLHWMTMSPMSVMAKIASAAPAVQSEAIADFRRMLDVVEKCKEQKDKFWKSAVARCPLLLPPTQQLVAVLRASGWAASADVKEYCRRRLSCIGQSKVCEDEFCWMRKMELKQANKTMSQKRMWREVVRQKVIDEVHHFQAVEWETEVVGGGEAGMVPREAFEPRITNLPQELRQCAGFSSPKWFTANPETSNVVWAELQQMIFADKLNDWSARAEACKWAQLLRPTHIAFKYVGKTQWYLSLGDLCGVCAVGWPATAVGNGAITYFQPDLSGRPQILSVTDPAKVVATTIRWQGLVNMVLGGKLSKEEAENRPAIRAVPLAPEKPLLQTAAASAFWTLGMGTLQWVCKQVGIEAGASTFDTLFAMLSHFMPKAKPEDIMDIIANRFPQPDALAELNLDSFDDLMHEEDRKDWAQEKDAEKKKTVRVDNIKHEWAKQRRDLASKQKGPKLRSPLGSKYPKAYPDGPISTKEALGLCPPGWNVHLDDKNCRWQFWESRRSVSISRAWLLHGFENACKRGLQAAWEQFLATQGFERSACPIENLLPQPVSQSAAPDQPAAASSSGS